MQGDFLDPEGTNFVVSTRQAAVYLQIRDRHLQNLKMLSITRRSGGSKMLSTAIEDIAMHANRRLPGLVPHLSRSAADLGLSDRAWSDPADAIQSLQTGVRELGGRCVCLVCPPNQRRLVALRSEANTAKNPRRCRPEIPNFRLIREPLFDLYGMRMPGNAQFTVKNNPEGLNA